MATEEKEKQSQTYGIVIWFFWVIGPILNGLVQGYLKRHHLVKDDLAAMLIGLLIGFGSISLVLFGFRKCAWFQRIESNKRIQNGLIFSFNSLVAVGVIYLVVMVCWRLWTFLKK
jgi:hypothetical protein